MMYHTHSPLPEFITGHDPTSNPIKISLFSHPSNLRLHTPSEYRMPPTTRMIRSNSRRLGQPLSSANANSSKIATMSWPIIQSPRSTPTRVQARIFAWNRLVRRSRRRFCRRAVTTWETITEMWEAERTWKMQRRKATRWRRRTTLSWNNRPRSSQPTLNYRSSIYRRSITTRTGSNW